MSDRLAQIQAILRGTALAAFAPEFEAASKRYGVPVGVLLGISKAESSFGSDPNSLDSQRYHNAWGWGHPPDAASGYDMGPDWPTAIDKWAKGVSGGYEDIYGSGYSPEATDAFARRYVGRDAPEWESTVGGLWGQFDGGAAPPADPSAQGPPAPDPSGATPPEMPAPPVFQTSGVDNPHYQSQGPDVRGFLNALMMQVGQPTNAVEAVDALFPTQPEQPPMQQAQSDEAWRPGMNVTPIAQPVPTGPQQTFPSGEADSAEYPQHESDPPAPANAPSGNPGEPVGHIPDELFVGYGGTAEGMGWLVAALQKANRGFGLRIGENTLYDDVEPVHVSTSNHYQYFPGTKVNRGADISGSPEQMAAFYQWAKATYGSSLRELYYDPLGGIKNGAEIGAIGNHDDHVHIAF